MRSDVRNARAGRVLPPLITPFTAAAQELDALVREVAEELRAVGAAA